MKRRFPRWARIVVDILLLSLLVLLFLELAGPLPCFRPEAMFRRVQRENLFGPSEMIQVHRHTGNSATVTGVHDGVLSLVTMFYDPWPVGYYSAVVWAELSLTEDWGCCDGISDYVFQQARLLRTATLFVFNEDERAASAQLEVRILSAGNETLPRWGRTYAAESKRENGRYFTFQIKQQTGHEGEDQAFTALRSGTEDGVHKISARLLTYDENGLPLDDRRFDILKGGNGNEP